MELSELNFVPRTAFINGKAVTGVPGVRLDSRSLEIHLHDRARIHLYTFNWLMLPIESKRKGTEQYKFAGPILGLYHDTADIREGPYVNHYIDQLEIYISYPSNEPHSILRAGVILPGLTSIHIGTREPHREIGHSRFRLYTVFAQYDR